MEIPFHTNSEHGQRHRLTLTFIGPLLCICVILTVVLYK